MRQALTAGLYYGLIVFGIGFVLGTIRIFLLMPHVSPVTAVMIEMPFMLLASWLVARWLVRSLAVPARSELRAAMGALAFVVLMACETALVFLLYGVRPLEYIGLMMQPGALPGLAGQLVFAAMPLLLLLGGGGQSGRDGTQA